MAISISIDRQDPSREPIVKAQMVFGKTLTEVIQGFQATSIQGKVMYALP
jgi:hypothetical protein